jgi:hypothetical protein
MAGRNDSGHEAVGQALLISGIAIGALSAAELTGFMLRSFNALMAALG